MKWEEGPVQLVRYNGYPSIRIVGDAAPGFSTGEAMAEMERLASQLPAGIGYEWTGLSYQEKVSAGQATSLFAPPSWWCSCCWWRSTRAGRSRCR